MPNLVARLSVSPGRVAVMGVLNVTPDSFSDGGSFLDPAAAVERALAMEADGADLIDVGGESTRPGAAPVPEADERARVVPVLRGLRRALRVPISIDTTKAAIARAALDEGADVVNDVSAGRDDRGMLALVAERKCGIVLMHRKGVPRTMQRRPRYRDVVAEVRDFLARRVARARFAGVLPESIAVDPGIGFGKTVDHNLGLLRGIGTIATLGHPVVVGVSRKSFLGKLLGLPLEARTEASVIASLLAALAGAQIVRVHDVGPMVRALRLASAIRGAGGEKPVRRSAAR